MNGQATSRPEPAVPRDAASLVLIRREASGARVLMGVRGSSARFMPERRVFPGGAVDTEDLAAVPFARSVRATCLRRLRSRTPEPHLAAAFALTAIRETWEETGLAVGEKHSGRFREGRVTGSWASFLSLGLAPAADRLRFVFRAVTPRSYPIRFDARFFLAGAESIAGDADDLSRASGELRDLAWLPVDELATCRELPLITRCVLKEVVALESSGDPNRPVPFFSDGHRGSPGKLD